MAKYDFSGWATRNDLQCADGRIIRKNAFKQQDGETVSLVWNHQHNSQDNVLGHALLENRDDGVYAYCTFNDTESGQTAKKLVQHGDVVSLSIWANQLEQNGRDVVHGIIRELSLVLAGANPGAFIDTVMAHGIDADPDQIEELVASYNENIMLYHSADAGDEEKKKKEGEGMNEKTKSVKDYDEEETRRSRDDGETIGDVFDTLSEKQKNVVYAIIGEVLEEQEGSGDDDDEDEGGKQAMKHNVFDQGGVQENNFLCHADQEGIISLAKQNNVGTLRSALQIYYEDNADILAHSGMEGVTNDEMIEALFPEFRDVRPGAPERIVRDQGWVTAVINKAYKTPFSRIRTRQMDARTEELRAQGYKKKGDKKKERGHMTLFNRTTDPQTIFVKDKLNRDDIVDITDFDVAAYIYQDMREKLNEEIAIAVMVGDGRVAGADGKIDETHIRPIWQDDDFFTIHRDVDFDAAKAELQGSSTGANFSENYIYAETIIREALYAREEYKGTDTPDFFCAPHLVNLMLLARDLNGRRIYETVDDLAKALNVGSIYTSEQFADLKRGEGDEERELIGIFVNMADYTIGSTKGGEITRFNQFDIDFNQEKYLLETRISGALTRYHCAIALEKKLGE